jgi:hypothetical protein
VAFYFFGLLEESCSGLGASGGKNRAFNLGIASPKIRIGTPNPTKINNGPESISMAGGFVRRKTTGIVTPPMHPASPYSK